MTNQVARGSIVAERVPFRYVRLRTESPPRRTRARAFLMTWCAILAPVAAKAQQASQPGFDPRGTERRFDASQPGQATSGQPALRVPLVSRPEVVADSRPLFELRDVSLIGAHAVARDSLIRTYQP